MKKIFLSISIAGLLAGASCNNNEQETKTDQKMTRESPRTSERVFGTYNNEDIIEYTITNANGMQVSIINYGATVTKIMVPDKNGVMGDVILGYDTLDGFLQENNPYIGAIVGRFANRITHATFTLDGIHYQLAKNNNGNSLHGGNKGFDKVVWKMEKIPGDSSLKLSYRSPEGEEGYPGNFIVQIMYTLTDDNALRIDYSGTTDKATPVNVTSHCYFNLSAGKDSTILDHELQINADKYVPVNDQLLPTGKIDEVKGTAMDFTIPKKIGKDIQQVKGGYDHNWVLRESKIAWLAALLYHPSSGRMMEVITTEPGLQFYSGNFLDGTLKYTKNGQRYVKYGGLCLEAQHYPDSPNQPGFPNTILRPGETYKQTTIYKFSVKQ